MYDFGYAVKNVLKSYIAIAFSIGVSFAVGAFLIWSTNPALSVISGVVAFSILAISVFGAYYWGLERGRSETIERMRPEHIP